MAKSKKKNETTESKGQKQETPEEVIVNKNQNGESTEEKACKEDDIQMQYDQLNDKYLRLYSEFDNYRKRTIREKSDLLKSASSDVIGLMLPVLDDFERAIQNMGEAKDIDAVKEGIDLIFNKMKKSLEQKGLEEIKAIGEEFDTDKHEAITNIPAPSDDMKGKVIDQVEKGYFLNGKVIRFSKVVVGQ